MKRSNLMKFLNKTNSLAIALAGVLSASANAATHNIESVTITQLFNSTFDGRFSKAVSDDGSFFGAVPILLTQHLVLTALSTSLKLVISLEVATSTLMELN